MFRIKGKDWYTEKELLAAPEDSHCDVCGSGYSLAINPANRQVVCELHSNCQIGVVERLIRARASGVKIEKSEWDELRLNSYDRDALIPYISDEVLIANTEYTLQNCSRISLPAGTYDEALQLYAKELIKRLQETKS